jgi:hypothetical protein
MPDLVVEPNTGPPNNLSTAFTTDTSTTGPALQVNGQSDQVFTQADIEAARTQEKDKMYKRLETLQETVSRLEQEAKTVLRVRAAGHHPSDDKSAAAEEKARLSQRCRRRSLAQREAEWKAQLTEVQTPDGRRAGTSGGKSVRRTDGDPQNIMTQYSDRIAPELMDMVSGETLRNCSSRLTIWLPEPSASCRKLKRPCSTLASRRYGAGDRTIVFGQLRVAENAYPEEIRDMLMKEYEARCALLGGGADGLRSRGMFAAHL